MQKQRTQHLQQQQQQQLSQFNGHQSSAAAVPTPQQQPSHTPSPQQQQLQQSTNQTAFTQEQKDRLKAQIYTYKFHLALKDQSVSIPPMLLQAIAGVNVSTNLRQYEAMHMAGNQQAQQQQNISQPVMQQIAQPVQMKVEQPMGMNIQHAPIQKAGAMQSVQPFSQQMVQNGYPHSAVQQVFNTGKVAEALATKPVPIDIQIMYKERERRIALRLKAKHSEFREILHNAASSHYDRIQATIGMKQLEVLKFQRAVRSQILAETKPLDQNRLNALLSQKTKEQLDKERRQVDRKKRKTEIEEANRRGNDRRSFLTAVVNNKKTIKDFYAKNRKKVAEKINKELVNEFEKRARRQKEREKREKKARLDALKANDVEAYKKMIKDTKNDRLRDLISQTDEILRSLGAQLINERSRDTSDEDTTGGGVDDERKQIETGVTSGYYKVAHRLTEMIERQPSILMGGDLKEYQLQGLQWMVSLYNNRLNGILADEMGLGKTIQTIALLSYLYEFKADKGPHLVIVPLTTIDNWLNEFKKWCPTLKVVVYGGNPTERKKIQQGELKSRKFNVLLTQYEFISRKTDVTHLKRVDWSYIIIDEGHRIKNANCKLVISLHSYKSRNRLLLTGTPLQNELKELWALLNFLLPNVFDSHVNFENWFNTGLTDKVDVDNEELYIVINRLHQVLRPFLLRREKSDVLSQLPEKVEKVIQCDISDLQRLYYQQIKQKRLVINDGKTPGRKNTATLNNPVMQLRKVCNHPFIFLDDYTQHFNEVDLVRASGKFELLDRMLPKLKASGHRCLIFSQMTQVLDHLEDYFYTKAYKFMRLDGDVKSDERGRLVKEFNAPNSDYFIFILSTRAGGLGLNLQAADTVIIFDSDWNPQQDLQAMARAHRIGQKNPVRVFTLVTATMFEQEVLAKAQEKRNAEAKIIGAGKFNQQSTESERQELLQKLFETNEDNRKYDIPSDESLNEMMARSEEEFELFQQMDEEIKAERERYWAQRGLPLQPRLMKETEFPEWLKRADEVLREATQQDKIENYGRGQRKREKVVYADDGMSDSELLESGSEVDDSSGSGKRGSKRKREQDDDEDEEDEDYGQSKSRRAKRQKKGNNSTTSLTATPQATGGRRARKKRDDDETDELQLTTDLQKQLYEVFKGLKSLKSEGRVVSELFMDLPDRKHYADYYQLIKQPICLNDIRQRILSNQYTSIHDMHRDVALMVSNAQQYNQEGSMVYNDSIEIMAEFLKHVPSASVTQPPQTPQSSSQQLFSSENSIFDISPPF